MHLIIGVDPTRVRGSGPSWNFASEGPPLFGPSRNVWSTVMKHSEHNLCQYQWIIMINEWLCDMSHCCHQTRFWALHAPKMRLRPGLCPRPCWGAYTAPPDPYLCLRGPLHGREGEGKGREEGTGREGKGGEGKGREMDPRNSENRSTPVHLMYTSNK